MLYSSGTSIASFPNDGLVIKEKLNHQGNEVVTGETKAEEDVAILGLYQVPGPQSGRIVLYGDSNCLDNAHMEKDCFWLLDLLIDFTANRVLSPVLKDLSSGPPKHSESVPERMDGNHLHKYSKVLDATQLGAIETVPLPDCPKQAWSKPEPLNITAPENLHKQRWLLSVNLDQLPVIVPRHVQRVAPYPDVADSDPDELPAVNMSVLSTLPMYVVFFSTLIVIYCAVLSCRAHRKPRAKKHKPKPQRMTVTRTKLPYV